MGLFKSKVFYYWSMYHSLKSRTILMTSVCPRTIVHIIIWPLKLNYMNIDILHNQFLYITAVLQ